MKVSTAQFQVGLSRQAVRRNEPFLSLSKLKAYLFQVVYSFVTRNFFSTLLLFRVTRHSSIVWYAHVR